MTPAVRSKVVTVQRAGVRVYRIIDYKIYKSTHVDDKDELLEEIDEDEILEKFKQKIDYRLK